MSGPVDQQRNLMSNLIDGMPRLIQAGMGAHISSARLANATSRLGVLGVVSGVGLRHILVEEVRRGNSEVIEAAHSFPIVQYIEEFLSFAPGGTRHHKPAPMDTPDPQRGALAKRLSTIAAYIEVVMAKKGHHGKVGINVMWKSALTVLPTIYGAMIAGVDALLCGAGVPMELPDILKRIRRGEDLAYTPLNGTTTHVRLKIARDSATQFVGRFKAPRLLPVLSNFAFPKRILDVWEREHGGSRPFGFVLENHTAGGHNAPPRNKSDFGDQDEIDNYFEKVRDLGLPVYIAGSFPNGGSREDFLDWLDRGAYGLQVGSRFALCEESGLREDLKQEVIEQNSLGTSEVLTSKRMSPTGFPFKYVPLPGTMSEPGVYEQRHRICNRGYLLQSHFQTLPDGSTRENYICPAMPEGQYEKLGGNREDTVDRVCLCNTLLATAGYFTDTEQGLVTLGVSGKQVTEHLTARQVVEEILTPEYVATLEQELQKEERCAA